jgi:cytidylate kinase
MMEGVGAVKRFVVAVDGPSGSGKSTVSQRLAQALGAAYLDTGAMYRAVTWAVLRAGVDLADADGIAKVAGEVRLESGTDPRNPYIRADGEAIDGPIRGPEVTRAVSAVAAVPEVRRLLVARQREIIAAADRIVVEGRDIGGVVAPEADLKVFLTASAAERSRRAADPLRRAPGAVELDTTAMGIDAVVDRLRELLAARVGETPA